MDVSIDLESLKQGSVAFAELSEELREATAELRGALAGTADMAGGDQYGVEFMSHYTPVVEAVLALADAATGGLGSIGEGLELMRSVTIDTDDEARRRFEALGRLAIPEPPRRLSS